MTPEFDRHLRAAEAHLSSTSGDFTDLIRHVGPCTFAPDPDLFPVLLRAVFAQLISTAAARSITLKFQAALNQKVTPARVAALTAEQLKACGISGAKQKTVHGIAAHFRATRGLPKRLAAATDDDVRRMLLPLYGVGPWTVDMLLMFGLGRPDILPVGDLGLRAGAKDLFRLAELPDAATLTMLAEPWRPYRAVATWFLWKRRGWVPQSGADGANPVVTPGRADGK